MLNRLAQVIHWIGFIISVALAAAFIVDSNGIDNLLFGLFLSSVSLAAGWAIRFILTGHKGLMPWS